MGHRLSKITTRTGDAGETGLGDGSRVPKDAVRVAALGDVDELNSAIGVMLAEEVPAAIRGVLEEVQHDLFDLGGELSIPGHAMLKAERGVELVDLAHRRHTRMVLGHARAVAQPGLAFVAGAGGDLRETVAHQVFLTSLSSVPRASRVCRRSPSRTLDASRSTVPAASVVML